MEFSRLEDRKLLASVTLAGTELTIRGDATDDAIDLVGSADYQSFTVSVNNDASLTQTFNYADVTEVRVFAGGGNDTVTNTLLKPSRIYGQGGNDTLYGGFLNDHLYGGDGDDVLIGQSGDDYLSGSDGADQVLGNPGSDTINGGNGDDILYGNHGDDVIGGQAGDDGLYGGDGDDSLNGGLGDDNLRGNAGNDTIHGAIGDDYLQGNDGDDLLFGQNDQDSLLGGTGNDTLVGGNGNDFLQGETGNDSLDGQAGNDSLNGGADDDSLIGGSGADTLDGGSGDDSLTANADQAVDTLRGGTGFDTFELLGGSADTGRDSVIDLQGMETFAGNAGPLSPSIEVDGSRLSVVGSDDRDVYVVTGFDNQSQFHVKRDGQIIGTYNSNDFDEVVVRLNGGNDSFTTNEWQVMVPLRIDGGDGSDFIEGGNGPDQLFGGAGNDSIHARNGDDLLVGGDGDDLLHGNAGNDQLFGGVGRDKLYGDSGDDVLVAGEDDDWDRLWGNGGFDQYFLELVEDHGYGIEFWEPVFDIAGAPAEPAFGDSPSSIDDDVDDPTDPAPSTDPPPLADTASIGDLVFEDLNENGILDADEAGLENMMVHLLLDHEVIATRATDALGGYLFDGLAAGSYTVELQTDSLGTRAATSMARVDVTLAQDERNLTTDFGVSAPVVDPTATSSIGDLVYIDENENGQFDAGEVGLEGVELQLILGTTVIDTTTTDENGNYTFSNLTSGTYQVDLQAETLGDRVATTNATIAVVLANDQRSEDADFGVVGESTTAPVVTVEEQFARVARVFSESFTPIEFAEVLTNLPAGTIVEVFDAFTIVNTGTRRLAFVTETVSNNAPFPGAVNPSFTRVNFLGNFPAAFSNEAIAQARTLETELRDVQSLQGFGEFALHTLPLGTLADFAYNGEGELTDIVIATAGDLTFIAGGVVRVAQGSATTIRYVTAADVLTNSAAAGVDLRNIAELGINGSNAGDLTFRVLAVIAGVRNIDVPRAFPGPRAPTNAVSSEAQQLVVKSNNDALLGIVDNRGDILLFRSGPLWSALVRRVAAYRQGMLI